MPITTTFNSFTLDGVSDVTFFSGTSTSVGSWDSGWIGYLSSYDSIADDKLDSTISLTGSNWTIKTLRFSATYDTITRITDLDGGLNRKIDYLELGYNSVVDLTTTRIKTIVGRDGASHDITLGTADTQSILLTATINKIVTGDGWVNSIQIYDGKATIIVNDGGAGSIVTDDGNDIIRVNAGNGVQNLSMRHGDDQLLVRYGSHVQSVLMGSGLDQVTVKNDSVIKSLQSNGGTVVDLLDSSRVHLMKLDDGTNTVTTANGQIESYYSWNGVNTLNIGVGGIQQIALSGNGDKLQTITTDGRIGSLQVYDNLRTNLILGDGGAGQIRLGDGLNNVTIGSGNVQFLATGDSTDNVTTTTGYVEFISAREGNDVVLVGSGGAGTVKTGSGEDKVTTGSKWVELINTGSDDDIVKIGSGGAALVRLGSGDDTIIVSEGDPNSGMHISGSSGSDTLNFYKYSTGVVFTLDSSGIWQNPAALGGDLDLAGLGYISETGIDNLTGTNFDDQLTGDNNDNILIGKSGNNVLIGKNGRDTLIGGNDEDTLKGGGGKDKLYGRDGDDDLFGGRGNDRLSGGDGADVFYFADFGGTDKVTDFEDGLDQLSISDHTGGFGTLVISDAGANLSITYDGGTIILLGHAGTVLTTDDFDFI